MRDRIVGAMEIACQFFEMLKIQNRHVVWDTHQIIIPAEHTKDAESRRIPFEPKGRLAQILKRQRFLGPKAYERMDESIATSSQKLICTGTTYGTKPLVAG
jgi:hypothetical protein